MKKLVLATALASVSTLAVANSGLYIQGDVGYSKLQYASDSKLRDNGAKGTIAFGKDTGDMRYQVDVTQYNDAKKHTNVVDGEATGKVSYQYRDPANGGVLTSGTVDSIVTGRGTDIEAVQSVGVSAIYDFETTNPMITPYAGARVSANHIRTRRYTDASYQLPDLNDPSVTTTKIIRDVKTKTKDKLGLGVSAGVQFHINNQFAVDTGVEYNHLGKVDGIKGDQFGAKVGARVNF